MVECIRISKAYRNFLLEIPSLSIGEGEITGLVGNNGAGKTTLLRLMLDLTKKDQGEITISGLPVSTTDEWKNVTGAWLDEEFLIPYLTPMEYLKLIKNLKEMSGEEFQRSLVALDRFAGEVIRNHGRIDELSKGNRAKIGITGACISNPKWLVLDEPFSHLDPYSRNVFSRYLKEHRERESITILSDHNLDDVSKVCNRVLLLHEGRIERDVTVHEDSMAEIRRFFENRGSTSEENSSKKKSIDTTNI